MKNTLLHHNRFKVGGDEMVINLLVFISIKKTAVIVLSIVVLIKVFAVIKVNITKRNNEK